MTKKRSKSLARCDINNKKVNGTRQTCKGAVRSDVMSDEAGDEHEQNHEQLGPGEPAAAHLHLQILETEERTASPTFYTQLKLLFSCLTI